MENYIIDRIKEAARIEEVIGDFMSLKRHGVNLVGLCPFHQDKTPSLNVSPSKNIFRCFACGAHGDSIEFIRKRCGLSYIDSLKYIANKYGIDTKEENKDIGYFHSIMHLNRPKAEEKAIPVYISPDRVKCYAEDIFLQEYHSNLTKYLLSYFDKETLMGAYCLYQMGMNYPRLDSMFWQIDRFGNVHTAHVIPYDGVTGHRLHKGDPRLGNRCESTWLQSLDFWSLPPYDREQKREPDPFTQCLFGEHLLSMDGKDEHGWQWKFKPVSVVESEKTALIMSMIMPQMIWVACCGLNNFNEAKQRALEGRLVTLYADADGDKLWTEKCEDLNKLKILKAPAAIVTMPKVKGCEKWDIADFELQKRNRLSNI